MSNQIPHSTAVITHIDDDRIQDIPILIDKPTLFNGLPGMLDHLHQLAVSETPAAYTQIPIFDMTTAANPTGTKARRRKVEKTLSEIRKLHEDLNAVLYSHPTERPTIHGPDDAFHLLQAFLGLLDHEELWLMDLDTRNRVMSLVQLYKGSVNSSQVRVGEVFRQAIVENSPSILLAHNHPSGDPTPSPDDVSVTRAIVQAGKLLDIDVLDHLIITRDHFISLKERGLGFGG